MALLPAAAVEARLALMAAAVLAVQTAAAAVQIVELEGGLVVRMADAVEVAAVVHAALAANNPLRRVRLADGPQP